MSLKTPALSNFTKPGALSLHTHFVVSLMQAVLVILPRPQGIYLPLSVVSCIQKECVCVCVCVCAHTHSHSTGGPALGLTHARGSSTTESHP
jgi:hypothetical protein